jgi:hypothetical protein
LDTDWALLPGALCKLAEMAEKAPADVGLLGGCAITDKGELWPVKLPPEGAFGFVEFLKWKDTKGASDFQACRRREVFETVQWPTERRLETQFHMKVAKVWKTMFTCETLSKAYTNSLNRWSTDQSSLAVDRVLKMAPYLAQDNNDILTNFGEDLRRYTPRRYWSILQNTVFRNFQAGDRLAGLKYAIVAIVYKPWMVQIWGIVILGLIGPRTLLKVNNTLWVRSVCYWFKEFNYQFWKK